MRRHVDILIAISEKHLLYSLFVKRIIAIEAQLYFLGLVGLKSLHFILAQSGNSIIAIAVPFEI